MGKREGKQMAFQHDAQFLAVCFRRPANKSHLFVNVCCHYNEKAGRECP